MNWFNNAVFSGAALFFGSLGLPLGRAVLIAGLCGVIPELAWASKNPASAEAQESPSAAQRQEEGSALKSAKKEKKDKSGSKQNAEKGDKVFNVPIPVGHDAKGIRLPYYDVSGNLQMFFNIQNAFRVDDEHLSMKNLMIETYDETGQASMSFDMPASILDLKTRIISSEDPVTIRRADFEITGGNMTFNTVTRRGNFLGAVRMVLHSQPSPIDATSDASGEASDALIKPPTVKKTSTPQGGSEQ